LDEESRAGLARIKENDREIDAAIDDVAGSLDTLANIASAMRDEVNLHPYDD
jgi:hypothetical protein